MKEFIKKQIIVAEDNFKTLCETHKIDDTIKTEISHSACLGLRTAYICKQGDNHQLSLFKRRLEELGCSIEYSTHDYSWNKIKFKF
jgi:hypothetical protein